MMTGTWKMRSARRTLLHSLNYLKHGQLTLLTDQGELSFGDPNAELQALIHVHHDRFYENVVFGGDEGAGDSYVDGDWSTPDLVALVRLVVRNSHVLQPSTGFTALVNRVIHRIRHLLHRNTIQGSRRNISQHYDLSNELFSLFLDQRMLYSGAVFPNAHASLEEAQLEKMDRLCRKLQLEPGDRVLEIGSGWGAFALHAAARYGCEVTTTTISQQQHDYVSDRIRKTGRLAGSVRLIKKDYRELTGRYDKIVSIEMFEAVGLRFYDEFFRACERLLAADGMMAMQTITMNEHRFADYSKGTDWIQRRIFPGGELASIREIQASLVRATGLSLFHMEEIGMHYAYTLAEWRRRFYRSLDEVRALGFDDKFIRTWEYYLAYCEGAFRERHIGTSQLVLTKQGSGRRHYLEPWSDPSRHLSEV